MSELIVVAVLLAVGGCQQDTVAVEKTITAMSRIADQVCSCQDVPCLDAKMRELRALVEPAAKPTKAQHARAARIAERLAACQKRILTESLRPAPPRPPPTAEAPP